MAPQRLARVTELDEEGTENEIEESAPEPLQKNKNRSGRNSNHLHVTIKTKPEEIERNSSHNNNVTSGSNRRPSDLIQEISSTRRPSAILAAIRSPKQFVNRYKRECVFHLQSATFFKLFCNQF